MDNPFEQVVGPWERVIEDMAATAEEYRDDGWAAIELHPGDVTTVTDPAPGFDVVVPGDEYETLREAVDDRTFDSYEVLRAEEDGVVFCLVALEAADDEVAVLVPTYYQPEDREDLEEHDGTLYTYVRSLTGEPVRFTHENPAPFFPDE